MLRALFSISVAIGEILMSPHEGSIVPVHERRWARHACRTHVRRWKRERSLAVFLPSSDPTSATRHTLIKRFRISPDYAVQLYLECLLLPRPFPSTQENLLLMCLCVRPLRWVCSFGADALSVAVGSHWTDGLTAKRNTASG